MEEVNASWISTMLPANPQLEIGTQGSRKLNGGAHEYSNPGLIQ